MKLYNEISLTAPSLGVLEDTELMELTAGGSTAALGELYRRHSSIMFSVLMQRLQDLMEAEDVLHDVFLKMQSKAAGYRMELGKPIAWMLTIARNAATDKLRRQITHRKYVDLKGNEIPPHTPAHTGLHADEVALLTAELDAMPNQYSNILRLAFFSGMTQDEISTRLAKPLGSVKSWMRRGLSMLRAALEGKIECFDNRDAA